MPHPLRFVPAVLTLVPVLATVIAAPGPASAQTPPALAAPPGASASAAAEPEAPDLQPEAWAEIAQAPRTVSRVSAPPVGGQPPPPPRGRARLASLGFSVGPGWLALRDAIGRDGQLATSIGARAAAVMAADWMVFLGVDHASTDRGELTFSQTAGLMGVKRFLFGRFYVGGALGLAWVQMSGPQEGLTDGPGYTLSAVAGVEAWRFDDVALTVEVAVSGAQYMKEAWEMGGVRIGCVVF